MAVTHATTAAGLKATIETWQGQGTLEAYALFVQGYHTARLADAMERIASHIENNQISVLEGTDIANALDRIARNK